MDSSEYVLSCEDATFSALVGAAWHGEMDLVDMRTW